MYLSPYLAFLFPSQFSSPHRSFFLYIVLFLCFSDSHSILHSLLFPFSSIPSIPTPSNILFFLFPSFLFHIFSPYYLLQSLTHPFPTQSYLYHPSLPPHLSFTCISVTTCMSSFTSPFLPNSSTYFQAGEEDSTISLPDPSKWVTSSYLKRPLLPPPLLPRRR